MNVRYRMELNQEERTQLVTMLSGGKHVARKLEPVQILLPADASETDGSMATNVSVGPSTVPRTKRCFMLGNLEGASSEAPRPGGVRKISGKQWALPVATACCKPPTGCKRWTLDLLAAEIVGPTGHVALSHEETARSKPWIKHLITSPSRPFPLADARPGT